MTSCALMVDSTEVGNRLMTQYLSGKPKYITTFRDQYWATLNATVNGTTMISIDSIEYINISTFVGSAA